MTRVLIVFAFIITELMGVLGVLLTGGLMKICSSSALLAHGNLSAPLRVKLLR